MSSENPTQQVKDTVYNAASSGGEWAQQNVVKPVQNYVAGDKGTAESGNSAAGETAQQVKETVTTAASNSGQWAQKNVVEPVQSYVSGDKSTESGNTSSQDTTTQVKDTVVSAASTSGEWAQNNVVQPIQSYMGSNTTAEAEKPQIDIPDEEREKIDRMEKEKVAEFLQERQKSSVHAKRK